MPQTLRAVNRTLAVICLCICVGIFLIGLWPFNFFPKNEVWWLQERNGLHFHGREIGSRFSAGGVAFSPDPLFSPQKDQSRKGSFSIEIWLNPATEPT
ncbi:MAG: hypothetical protein IMF11_11845 [Proteobacteria bacterium]|nr:hypothetical protein [Pseudomonadota bacterium]